MDNLKIVSPDGVISKVFINGVELTGVAQVDLRGVAGDCWFATIRLIAPQLELDLHLPEENIQKYDVLID